MEQSKTSSETLRSEDAAGADARPSVLQVAFRGLCPRCGSRTLFDGVATIAPKCQVCGLDFSRFNVGDGPAAFLTLILGVIILVPAIWLELTYYPPIWVHALIWIPLTALAIIVGLRLGKAALLALEYRYEAGEAGQEEGAPNAGAGTDSDESKP